MRAVRSRATVVSAVSLVLVFAGGGVSTALPAGSDLSITGSAAPDPVAPGQVLAYQFDVGNAGPDAALAVVATVTLPAGVSFGSATSGQGSCSQVAVVVTCNLGGLAASAATTVTISVTPAVPGGAVATGTVAGAGLDPDPTDNVATVSSTVTGLPVPTADVGVTGTASPDPVAVGQQLTYRLDVGNAGALAADGVTLTDTPPAGATFGSASSSAGSCSQAAAVVTCDLGSIPAAAHVTATITVSPAVPGDAVNAVAVATTTLDANLANNALVLVTTVDATGSPQSTCRGSVATIVGTVGRDALTGTPGRDVVTGLGGADVIRGLGGGDVLCGGAGNDTLAGGTGSDTLVAGPGADRLRPGPGADRVAGGPGRDVVVFEPRGHGVAANLGRHRASGQGADRVTGVENATGTARPDVLVGTRGPNVLRGLGGGDRLVGRAGPDGLFGGAGPDGLAGGPGVDRCRQGAGRGRSTGCER